MVLSLPSAVSAASSPGGPPSSLHPQEAAVPRSSSSSPPPPSARAASSQRCYAPTRPSSPFHKPQSTHCHPTVRGPPNPLRTAQGGRNRSSPSPKKKKKKEGRKEVCMAEECWGKKVLKTQIFFAMVTFALHQKSSLMISESVAELASRKQKA